MTFGEKLKKERIKIGFKTQSSLARAINENPCYISRWENDIFIPSARNYKKLLKLFGLKSF